MSDERPKLLDRIISGFIVLLVVSGLIVMTSDALEERFNHDAIQSLEKRVEKIEKAGTK
jgi:hypothetical protein